MDIRRKTVLIIRREGQYLVGYVMGTTILRWSISPWDAWATRNRVMAQMVAGRVGGEILLFNPVAGQMKEVKEWKQGKP